MVKTCVHPGRQILVCQFEIEMVRWAVPVRLARNTVLLAKPRHSMTQTVVGPGRHGLSARAMFGFAPRHGTARTVPCRASHYPSTAQQDGLAGHGRGGGSAAGREGEGGGTAAPGAEEEEEAGATGHGDGGRVRRRRLGAETEVGATGRGDRGRTLGQRRGPSGVETKERRRQRRGWAQRQGAYSMARSG